MSKANRDHLDQDYNDGIGSGQSAFGADLAVHEEDGQIWNELTPETEDDGAIALMRRLASQTVDVTWYEASTPYLSKNQVKEYARATNGLIDYHAIYDLSGSEAVVHAPQFFSMYGKDQNSQGLARLGFRKVRANSVPVSVHRHYENWTLQVPAMG